MCDVQSISKQVTHTFSAREPLRRRVLVYSPVPVSTCVHRMLVMALGVVEWQDLEDALFDFPEVWARLTVEARQRMEVRF